MSQHLPPLTQFQVTQVTWSEPQLSPAQGMGRHQEVLEWLGILTDIPKRTIKGEMAPGLAVVWAHPYQAWVSSLDEVAKKLNLLTTSGRNWAYTFVQFNKDAQHVPLPREGHLSTMIDGVPSRNVCGHLCQLEICQLLQWEDQVVYPEWLNRGLEPVVTSLPQSVAHGMSMFNEPAFLLVDLSQVMPGEQVPKPSAPLQNLITYFPYSPHYQTSP